MDLQTEQQVTQLYERFKRAKTDSAGNQIRAICAKYGITVPMLGSAALAKRKGGLPADAVLPPMDNEGPQPEQFKRLLACLPRARRKKLT